MFGQTHNQPKDVKDFGGQDSTIYKLEYQCLQALQQKLSTESAQHIASLESQKASLESENAKLREELKSKSADPKD